MKCDPRRRLVTMFLVVAFALTAVSVTSADDTPTPRISIVEMRHDLGQVFEREIYRYEFKVKNTGTADLEIKKVKPG